MPTQPLIFTKQALRDLDRRAVEEFHIPILTLMENAGRAVADAALRLLKHKGRTLILTGPGNNGGDGLVAARHLHNAGIAVTLLLLSPRSAYRDAAAAQLAIVDAMKLPVETISPSLLDFRDWIVDASPTDLVIDALFGTGLSRPVEGPAADLIRIANASGHRILAVDIPSGLDCDTGLPVSRKPADAVIRATKTVTFCGLKPGFAHAAPFLGKITIADIGAPLQLLHALALNAPPPA